MEALLILLPGIAGLLVLAAGAYAARRTWSVIACAALAALLLGAQALALAFAMSFAGFSGDSHAGSRTLGWTALAGSALVIAFVAFKLPRVRRNAEVALPPRDGARIAAALIGVYLLYRIGLVAWYSSNWSWVLITTAVGLALAWGLWQHRAWGWYGALAAVAYLLLRFAWSAFSYPHAFFYTLVYGAPSLLLLLSLLAVLVLSNARQRCLRSEPSPQ